MLILTRIIGMCLLHNSNINKNLYFVVCKDEKNPQPRHGTSRQTRINGKFNLQLEKIFAFYHQKTKCFSPSCFPKTREALFFFKNNTYSLQKIDFKPTQFLQFELHLKNKTP